MDIDKSRQRFEECFGKFSEETQFRLARIINGINDKLAEMKLQEYPEKVQGILKSGDYR